MLTLFILKSGKEDADPDRARRSFGSVVNVAIELNALEDVSNEDVLSTWYGIIYDDEHADENLAESLKTFLMYSPADVLVIYKKVGDQMSRCSRLFKKTVSVQSDSLVPVDSSALNIDTILNGFIT